MTAGRPRRLVACSLAALLTAAMGGGCANLPAPTAPLEAATAQAMAADTRVATAVEAVEAVEAAASQPAASGLVQQASFEPMPDADRGDLWLRLRSGFVLAELDSPLVRKWEGGPAGPCLGRRSRLPRCAT